MAPSPSTLTVKAMFTTAGGQPATGLVLTDISFRLVRIHKNGQGEETVWSDEKALAEIGTSGIYFSLYDEALLDDYNYFSSAVYSGPALLDSDNYTKRYHG